MKKIAIGFFSAILLMLVVAASHLAIENGILRSNFDGNSFAITNLGQLSVGRITNLSLTASRAIQTRADGAEESSLTTSTELGYVHGVTSDLQTQISAKQTGPLTGDVTTSGTTATLANVGTAGTYRSVTFNAKGLETGGSNPTTFAGYAISDTSANLASALTDETGTGAAVFGTSPTFTTRITTPQADYTTNQATMAPDFSLGEQFISTNAAFTVLAPVGISSAKTTVQICTVSYTNSTAAVVVITPPANVHALGTWNVTNWTEITFRYYPPSGPTNAYALPVF